ncbi:LemA family [Aedoeadaptatus ivorii]|uniref:LemA family n=1 Tax=Aedoeadaptatus ivorii TaxID=54006 RepID=A0A3S4ZQ31_9FIRM|nr:LemA family protein [Peptoniphilus ivorii]MDQ0508986.1 LemA protein [Peptoniphilus ivorii]VEJ35028.1 LemA family [Peptoniphilus ivorii]
MKKWIPVAVILVLIAVLFGSTYNKFQVMDENVDQAWAQVENTMQRRADLIPNLVETVKGYAKHEEDVFTKVTEARSAVQRAETPKEYAAADAQMNEAIRNINVVAEAYPELKANEGFQNLQAELAGTENRIAVERKRYNESVGDYNRAVKRFPTNLVAGILGFHEREYFQLAAGADQVPQVKF